MFMIKLSSNFSYLTNFRNAFATTFKGTETLDRHKVVCQHIIPSNSIVRDQVSCFFEASSNRHDLIQTSHQRELLSAFLRFCIINLHAQMYCRTSW